MKNLRFKPDALADFDLPITVTAGLLGSLTLKVPWSNLGRQPVEVSIDRLYILAKPKKESDVDVGPAAGKNAKESHEALEAAFQKAKLQRVKRQEARWIDDIKEMENKKAGSSAGRDGPQPSHGGAGAFIRGLIDTIIGNLQLSITNLHVRYEDDVTNKGHPFACGVTLESIAGFTVDDLGRQAFVTSSPLDLLRKAFVLRRIALYFDCETPPWKPKRSWHALSPVEWQGWFQPGIAAEDESQVARQYVLHPVDGRSTYVRRGRNVKRKEEEPASEIELNLDSVAIGLTQPQYRSYSLLLSEVSTYTARLPQVGYRPKERPAPGVRARIWWHYAWLAIRQQREAHQMPWSRVIWCAQMQRKYISAYIRHLKQEKALLPGGEQNPTKVPATGGDGGEGQAGGMQEITSMETSLPENTILMFRRIAYVELERERRKEERSGKSRTTKGQESTVGGWLGWLVGSRQSKPGESEGRTEGGSHIPVLPAADEENLGEQRSDLSEEEYTKLLELVERQEEGLKLSVETPYTLLTSVRVSIGVASAALRGNDDSLILGGSLEGIYAGVDMYPTTSQFQVEVTSMGMDGIDGVFIRTGAIKAEPQEMDRASELEKSGCDIKLIVVS